MAKKIYQKFWEYQKRAMGSIRSYMNTYDVEPLRPMIEYIAKQNRSDELVGVEIGTQYGSNALSILSNIPIKKLYLVDPYKVYSDYTEWIEDDYWKNQDMKSIYEDAKNKLSKFKDKIVFIKKMSSEAVNDVPDNLDFVYIDGNHAYEYVKKDIELWFPKIKKGGIIGGHDMHHQGVARAFVEFVYNKKEYYVGNSYHPDWWVIKKGG